MLYNLLAPLTEDFQIFNLFRYITFRTGGSVMTSLIICFLIGPRMIRWLKSKQAGGQPIRDASIGPDHVSKAGTPTMGGLMILISAGISVLLWSDLTNPYVWIVLGVITGFGLIGMADDYAKLTKRSHHGVPGKIRLLMEGLVAGLAAATYVAVTNNDIDTGLAIPFVKDFLLPLGIFFVPFAIMVIVGASNAVNLTDGLDGLAIVPVMIAAACFGAICYLAGHAVYAPYLGIHLVPGAGELAIICGALIGAGMGLLWFNAPPAMVFMGDTGSLSMGAGLGAIAMVVKHELVLAIIGGLFVLETVSVIVQVASFKLTGKRVFAMAPLHHHFEKKGWSEPTIVIRFWIIAVILALVGLSTLKLR